MNKKRVEQVVADFTTKYNCCQSLLLTYGIQHLRSKELAIRLGTGFGGGIASHGLVCGAVTGGIISISLAYGMTEDTDTQEKEKTYEIITEFIKQFKSQHGTIQCNELLECDIHTAEGQETIREKNLFQIRCPEFIRTAAQLLEELLKPA